MRGSGRVGPTCWLGIGASWPFAYLEVYADRLEFGVLPVKYTFPRASVVALVRHRVWLITYLRIVHTNPAYHKWVLFDPGIFPFARRLSDLEKVLSEKGYQVEPDGVVVPEPNVNFPKGLWWVSLIVAIIGICVAIFTWVHHQVAG